MIKLMAVLATLGALWAKAKVIYKKLEPLLKGFIEEAEERAKDGTIDKSDRKALAMRLIEDAQKNGDLRKFGFLERLIISKIIDIIAQKLPDFTFNKKPDNA